MQCAIGGFLPLCKSRMDEREAGHWLKLKDFETVGVLMELSQARHTGYAFLFLCFTPGEVGDAPVKAASFLFHALLHYAPVHLYALMPWCPGALCPSTSYMPWCMHLGFNHPRASFSQLPHAIYPHPQLHPSICSCETLFPH